MQIRKARWSRMYESAEEELVQLLKSKRILARRWTGEEGHNAADRHFATETQLWCAEGLLTCTVEGKTYSLQPGDVLYIPANTTCAIRVGFGGCTCYESLVRGA